MTSRRQLGRAILERVYESLGNDPETWESRELICQAMRNLPGPAELAMKEEPPFNASGVGDVPGLTEEAMQQPAEGAAEYEEGTCEQ